MKNNLYCKKASKSDFLNSIKSNIIFLFTAFGILSLSMINLIGDDIKDLQKIEYFQFFENSEYSLLEIEEFYIIFLLLGILSAIKAYSFLWKTNRTNVYLSLPITRTKLYTNRYLASLTCFATGITGAFLVGIILNTISYGFNKTILFCALYNIIALLIPAMLGFTIGASICVSVGKMHEAIIFSLYVLTLPTTMILNIDSIINKTDNGITQESFDSFIEPYITSFSEELESKFFNSVYPSNNFVEGFGSDKLSLNFSEDIIPILFPFLISLAFLVIGIFAFKRRKPEIAQEIGGNKFLVVLVPSILLISTILDIRIKINEPKTIIFLIFIIAVYFSLTSLACFLIYKDKRQTLCAIGIMPIILLCGIVILGGASYSQKDELNRIPEVDEIERAYAVPSGCDVVLRNVKYNQELTGANMHDTRVSDITDTEDLKLLTDIHRLVIDNLGNGKGTFKVLYFLKDGTTVARAYHSINNEASKQTYKLYDTKAYEKSLEYYLTINQEQFNKDRFSLSMSDDEKSEYIKLHGDTHSGLDALSLKNTELTDYQAIIDGKFYLTDSSQRYSVSLQNLTIEQKLELKKTLYSEYSKLTFDERFFNDEKPLYYLAIVDWEPQSPNQYAYSSLEKENFSNDLLYTNEYYNIPIYSSMSQSLNYIDSLGISKPKIINTDDIECVYMLKANTRYDSTMNEFNDLSIGRSKYCYNSTLVGFTQGKHFFETHKAFEQMAKGKRIDNRSDIENIYSYSRLNAPMLEDNGYIALFRMNDSSIFLGYVREKDISTLNNLNTTLYN